MLTGRRLVVVFVGLQLGMILSTIDGTIVATALPSINRDLGGLARLSWVITAYFLAQVAAPPVFLAAVPIGILSILVALRLQERPLREHAHFGPDTIATPWSGSGPPTTG